MKLELTTLNWGIDNLRLIKSVSLTAKPGNIVGLVGPNGSGKSSLLRLIYKFYLPQSGAIYLNGEDIESLDSKHLARKEAVVTQERNIEFEFAVYEIVLMGRTPHKNLLESDTPEDGKIVRDALRRVGMSKFLNREFSTLSGGEKQRVLIARALAQKTKVMLLDEPTNHLDPRYQIEIMELIRSLGLTTVVAMHDINIAATYCNMIYLLKCGRIIASGKPSSVLTKKLIKSAYGVIAEVDLHPKTGKLNIVFTGLKKRNSY
jgi:iron complex transport system ATP-binding protein